MSTWPYQSTETRDQLRVLGLYLAEQIDVVQVSTGRVGQLRGLPYSQPGERPQADVSWYLDAEAQAECAADDDVVAGKVLPLLYAFEDLATEIELRDGCRLIPAVAVAAIIPHSRVNGAEFTRDLFGNAKLALTAYGEYAFGVYKASFVDGIGYSPAEIILLRELHFAVGLRPDQFHRRTL